MAVISEYVLTILAAALLCAIVMKLLDGKGSAAAVAKMICGVFLLFSVISPFWSLQWTGGNNLVKDLRTDAEKAIAIGENSARESMEGIITEQVTAYILDKASVYHAQLEVDVILSQEQIPVPVGVTLRGSVSPYVKSQLQGLIADNLGIKKEDQKWISPE